LSDPNRQRRRFLLLSLLVLVPLVAAVLWSASDDGKKEPGPDALYRYLAIFSETLNLVRQSYVEPTDVGTLLAGAMEGSTDALDAFSIFLPAAVPVDAEAAVIPGARHAGLLLLKDRGVAFAASVEDGSVAAAAGFEEGDIIAGLGDRQTRQMPLWEINQRLAGPAGAKLGVEIVRRGETKRLELTLGESPAPAPRLERPEGLPMLRVPRFEAAAVEPVRGLLAGLRSEGATQLLVDLRGVAGGDPESAYQIAALFAQGELGALKEKEKVARSFRGDLPAVFQGTLAVLVDGSTCGAAEILAAALQQKAGAKLVGVPTFGWAGERSKLELSSGARLLLTTAYFAGPDGKPLSDGQAPDLLVDELSRRFEERERPLSELILDRGIRYLRGELAAEEQAA